MRSMPLAVAVVFTLSGCATSSAHDPAPAAVDKPPAAVSVPAASSPSAFANTHWRFVEVAGKPLPANVDATLTFNADRHVSGHAGCNGFGGAYQHDADGALRFGAILSTKMACLQPPGAMQAEQGIFDALSRAARARKDGATLLLQDANGATLAALQP